MLSWPSSRRRPMTRLLSEAIPVAPDPGGQGGRAGVFVAGDQVEDDLDGLLAVLRDGAAQLRDLGGALEPDPVGCQKSAWPVSCSDGLGQVCGMMIDRVPA